MYDVKWQSEELSNRQFHNQEVHGRMKGTTRLILEGFYRNHFLLSFRTHVNPARKR